MYFSPNTNLKVVAAIREELQLRLMTQDKKYLGLPIFMGKDKVRNFVVVKERINSKVAEWK